MTLTPVKAHTRGVPDPLTPVIESRRQRFARKWGVELVTANDDRLAVPVAEPVIAPSRMSLSEITAQLKALALRARSAR